MMSSRNGKLLTYNHFYEHPVLLFLAINHLDLFNKIFVPGTGNNFFPTARPVFCTLSIQTFRREVDTYRKDYKCPLNFLCNFWLKYTSKMESSILIIPIV